MKGSFIHKMKVVFRATVIQNSRLERRRRETSEQCRRELAESYKNTAPHANLRGVFFLFRIANPYDYPHQLVVDFVIGLYRYDKSPRESGFV
jgi:hypothetical protein